jgi:hypothetical protein
VIGEDAELHGAKPTAVAAEASSNADYATGGGLQESEACQPVTGPSSSTGTGGRGCAVCGTATLNTSSGAADAIATQSAQASGVSVAGGVTW